MADTLFGQNLITTDGFEIIFSGDAFDSSIEIRELINELNAIEKLIRVSIPELKRKNLIDVDLPKFKILVKIENGSIIQRVNIAFEKPANVAILSALVGPLMIAIFSKALDYHIPDYANRPEFQEILAENQQLRAYLAEVISPVASYGGEITFNIANTSTKFNKQEALLIQSELTKEEELDEEIKRNGVFLETRIGKIRKVDLDNKSYSYFGFSLEGGRTQIPMSIEGAFDFNEYRALVDKPISVTGEYTYKNDEITQIKLRSLEPIETIEQLSSELAR